LLERLGGVETYRRLAETARDIGHILGQATPPGVGYCLLLFGLGDDPEATYIANCRRGDMIKFLREFVEVLDRRGDSGPGVLSRG
jgi:hypothetical protein